MVVLTEKANEETRIDMFERINMGVGLNDMERRMGTSPGPLLNLISQLAEEPKFQKLCPFPEPLKRRRKPEEFILRFLAYLDNYKNFERPVNQFLDAYLEKYNHPKATSFDEIFREFHRMLNFVEEHFPSGFVKKKGHIRTPRIRFETISVGVALALREKNDLKPNSMEWLDSKEFKEHIVSDSSIFKHKVIERIEYVRDRLLGKL